jgi:phospho-N-acetylmuramoyl-pentapeptide-transferase
MIYHVSKLLMPLASGFNVIHYVSFRALASLLTAILFSFIFGSWFIKQSQRFFRAKSRAHAPEHHKKKDDMPTMGGIFILSIVFLNSFLWCNLADPKVWIMLGCMLGFGVIGFIDDWCKIHATRGIKALTKATLQVGVAALVALGLIWAGTATTLSFPFFKMLNPGLGWLYIPWAVFVIVGCSNAVNLTDGLDGLAIGSLIPNFATFSIIAFLAGNWAIAQYLHIPFAQSAELAIIGATLLGASIGFLWYNTYPAQIFMGDVGSLALGSGLAAMALLCKQELLLPIAGGLFVLEASSVIIQVLSFKFLGRRVFKMAPIHHHFELQGWKEAKITVRFGIISFILCLITLMTLKIR